MDGGEEQMMTSLRQYPLLFEILRSFNALAQTLNLSQAVRNLKSTRQTVRRHIAQLEELKGGPLFHVTDRQYQLSDLGMKVLPEAQDLLARAEAWVVGQSSMVGGMQHLSHSEPNGWCFYQQQHPMGRAYTSSSPLFQEALVAWTQAGGNLEHEAMQSVRPYFNVFRRAGEGWLLTEVGEKSAYVSWFGWAAARSNIGRPLGRMPGGDNMGRLVDLAHEEVEANQSARLDHVFTHLPRGPEGAPEPVSYERLLLGSKFPDGSFAMISTVRRTYDLEIMGVTREMLRQMPEEFLM